MVVENENSRSEKTTNFFVNIFLLHILKIYGAKIGIIFELTKKI